MLERNPALKGILLASVTSIFWGVLAIFLKVAVKVINPYSIVWIRFLISFIMLSAWFLYTDPQKLRILIRPPILLLLGAFFLAVNFIGYMQGVKYSGPENAQIIIQLGPILLAAGGVIFFRERLSIRQFAGFILAGAGLLLFYGDQYQHSLVTKTDYLVSVYYTVVAAIAWAIYGIFQKKLVRTWHPQQLNLVIYGLPILMLFPFIHMGDFSGLNFSMWMIVAFLALNTLIAYGAFAACLKYIDVNQASIIVALNPIITFISMALLSWLNVAWIQVENITLYGFIGAALVLAGAVLAVMPRKMHQELKKQKAFQR